MKTQGEIRIPLLVGLVDSDLDELSGTGYYRHVGAFAPATNPDFSDWYSNIDPIVFGVAGSDWGTAAGVIVLDTFGIELIKALLARASYIRFNDEVRFEPETLSVKIDIGPLVTYGLKTVAART